MRELRPRAGKTVLLWRGGFRRAREIFAAQQAKYARKQKFSARGETAEYPLRPRPVRRKPSGERE